MSDNECVVTIELRIVVSDTAALVAAGADASSLVHPSMPDEMKVTTALEALLPPPSLRAVPGVRPPESGWTARTEAKQQAHRDLYG